ncbi:acyltransferase [Paracoccus sp. Ld10]|uniref:acyltransferase n=1 Tax=Paracoccus sp. Ld10 TaxID=649158 RepID=UPI00386DB566
MSKTADGPLLNLHRKNAQTVLLPRTTSERLAGIELGRIIACLAVIFIHQNSNNYGAYYNIREILDFSSRWAVPFFFIFAGYFMPAGTGWLKVSVKYFNRLFPVFIFWVTAYEAIAGNPFWFLSNSSVILKNMTNGGVGFHLWFLPSLGVCLAIAAVVRYYFSIKILLLLAVFLYLCGLVNGSYEAAIVDLPFSEVDRSFNPRNGPFMGLLFVSLGAALRIRLFKSSTLRGLMLIALGVVLSVTEATFLFYFFNAPISSHNFLIGTVPFGFGIAVLCMSVDIQIPFLAAAIRRIGAVSLGIYALHMVVLWKVTNLIEPNSLISGLLTAALTLIIATAGALIGAQIPVLKRVFC